MEALNLRDINLECVRLAFGRDGQLALAEYYAALPDPAAFSWFDAVLFIADRLGMDGPELMRRWAETEPVERMLLEAAAELRG